MSEGGRVLRKVRVTDTAYRIEDVSSAPGEFVEAFGKAPRAPLAITFPRTWSQVEALVEERLTEFESRQEGELALAFERGRIEGRREQEAEVDRRLREAGGPWQALQDSVREELDAHREELYRGTTELATALARAWLGSIVEIHPRTFEVGLQKALEALAHQDVLEVRLHPTDYEAFRKGLDEKDSTLWESPEVTVTADASVDRGGAVAVARGGTADARLSVRVQKALEWLHLAHDPR